MNKQSDDQVWTRDEIQSPCVKLCTIHPETRLCTGCHRSLDEIGRWSKMTSDERTAIMQELPARGGALKKRRGGRNARLNRS